MSFQHVYNFTLAPVSDVITRDKRLDEMIQTSKRG